MTPNLSSGVTVVISAIDKASAVISRVTTSLRVLSLTALKFGSALLTPFRILLNMLPVLSVGLATLMAGVVGVLTKAVMLGSQMQQSRIAFSTMLGSQVTSNQFLKQLEQFAAVTPFRFSDLLSTVQRFFAYGFKRDNIIRYLTAVGDAAAAMGGSPEVMERITRALGQMQAKGKVVSEEMRQMAEVGIPVWQYLADYLGVDIPRAMKMTERSAVSAAQGIEALVSGIEKAFGGMMAKQAVTLQGRWSTLMDTLEMGMRKLGETMIPVLTNLVYTITLIVEQFLESPAYKALEQFFTNMFTRESIQKAVTVVANIVALLRNVGGIIVGLWASIKDSVITAVELMARGVVKLGNAVIYVVNQVKPLGTEIENLTLRWQVGILKWERLMLQLNRGRLVREYGQAAYDRMLEGYNQQIQSVQAAQIVNRASANNNFPYINEQQVVDTIRQLINNPSAVFEQLTRPMTAQAQATVQWFMKFYDQATKGGQAQEKRLAQIQSHTQSIAANTLPIDEFFGQLVYGGGERARMLATRLRFGSVNPLPRQINVQVGGGNNFVNEFTGQVVSQLLGGLGIRTPSTNLTGYQP